MFHSIQSGMRPLGEKRHGGLCSAFVRSVRVSAEIIEKTRKDVEGV